MNNYYTTESRSEMLFWRMLDEYCTSVDGVSAMEFDCLTDMGLTYSGQITSIVSPMYDVFFYITEDKLYVKVHNTNPDDNSEMPLLAETIFMWNKFQFTKLIAWLIENGN